jgi:hypothetical protein
MTFNPVTDIPQTDDQARTALMHERDDLIGRNLVGIFNVHRSMNKPLLEAYRLALEAHVNAAMPEFLESIKR